MKLALTTLVFLFSSLALAATTPLWTDLDDVIQYAPKAMPDAAALKAAMKSDPRFTSGNAKFSSGLHLDNTTAAGGNGIATYNGFALMSDNTGRLFYRKFVIDIDSAKMQITNVTIVNDLNLSQMHFTISAGLIDRMVVVEDVADGVLLAFPLGVGGLDDAVMGLGKRLLTPLYHGAWLDRSKVTKKRTDPAYYRGQPFIPITSAKGNLTPIAFHITILSDDDWKAKGPNYLMRGFESHGCMRLRLKDLTELFAIVENSADKKIPVDVDYFIPKHGEHPYPLEAKSYMSVQNFAAPGKPPEYRRDDQEHLVIMERVNRAPDLGGLKGLTGDEVLELTQFEGFSIDSKILR